MPSPLNKKLSFDSDWKEWSNYVLITLEKLSDEISQRDKERSKFKEKMLIDLMALKESLITKINESEKINKKNIDEVLVKIELMIKNVSQNHTKLSDKFTTFNEDVIIPLRIRIAVFSIVSGAVGGIIVYCLAPLFSKAITGG